MTRCPECGERLRADPDRYGARCPACREPLYDQPSLRRGRGEDGRCAAHPDNPAPATCARCGNYLCDACYTRWRGRGLCAACVSLALEHGDAPPAEASGHLRQALLALGLGLTSWVLFLVFSVLGAAAVSEKNVPLILLAVLPLFLSPLPALAGVGLGCAAIRSRGDHMILATIGLVLSGLNVGALIGLFSFSLALQT
jgi:hypothetical protein